MDIDPGILRRLLHVKDLIQLARDLRRRGTRLGEAEALVILDAAVEAALPAILSASDVSFPARFESVEILNLMVQKGLLTPKQASAFGRLHHVRNQIQHFGLVPDSTQVEQFGSDAISALRSRLESLGTPLETLSTALLIRHEKTRALFSIAEETYRSGDFPTAAIALVTAFEEARQLEQSRIYGSGITWAQEGARTPEGGPPPHTHDGLVKYAEKIQDEVEILKLRLDYKEYRKFADLTGGKLSPRFLQHLPSDEDPKALIEKWRTYLAPRPIEISEAWFRFGFEFVRDSILRWESVERSGLWEDLFGALDAIAKAFTRKGTASK